MNFHKPVDTQPEKVWKVAIIFKNQLKVIGQNEPEPKDFQTPTYLLIAYITNFQMRKTTAYPIRQTRK